MTTPTYKVMVDQNSHYLDESERYSAGEFWRIDGAIEAAKKIVDRSLAELSAEGRTSDEIFEQYCLFGDDPFIVGFDGDLNFSAREYARDRCDDMAGVGWRDLAQNGRFADAEPAMLRDTRLPDGYFPFNEVRASFYENWGDSLSGTDAIEKYSLALDNWQMFASCSTSGGEGTARMMDVKRVQKKLDRLTR